MPNLDAALKTIRERVSTTVFQGRSFERLVRAALLKHHSLSRIPKYVAFGGFPPVRSAAARAAGIEQGLQNQHVFPWFTCWFWGLAAILVGL